MRSRLSDLAVLAFDCQATHPDPNRGYLLEVGWVSVCLDNRTGPDGGKAKSFLVELPPEAAVPPQVLKVTGLGPEDLERGIPIRNVAQELLQDLIRVGSRNLAGLCPIVIHYSRYERPFLRRLLSEAGPGLEIETEAFCTHQISQRLLTGLPRRGLRAVAGFFGHSVSRERRAAGHAVATAVIWTSLVPLLSQECDVGDLDQLRDWLRTTPGSFACGTQFPMERRTRLAVTDEPGVYRMRRSNGDLLYVGKATSLRKRVNSYFQRKKRQPDHILEMLAQAYRLDVTATPSSLEAALIESDEIKRLSPPYNIALQERDRQLVFLSRNLRSISRFPDSEHPFGPVVGRFLLLRCLVLVLTDPERGRDVLPSELIGLPESYCPDQDCCHQGIEIFRSRYAKLWRGGSVSRRLIWLGTRLWKLRMDEQEAKESAPEVAEPQQEKETADRRDWNPERVCRSLEGVVTHGAYLLRRARWFRVLSDSVLVWNARTRPEEFMVVRLEGGRMAESEILCPDGVFPTVNPRTAAVEGRQQSLDLAAYDRLSVLTAELRRLLRENRSVSLGLGKVILRNDQLSKVLRWV